MTQWRRQAHVEQALQVARSGEVPTQPLRLSRRNRSIVLDADFLDDRIATVWIVRRGQIGEPTDVYVRLGQEGGQWAVLGGGSSSPGQDLDWRPSLAEAEAMQRGRAQWKSCPFGVVGGGSQGTLSCEANTIYLTLASEVAELRFSDRDPKRAPHHGRIVFLSYGNREPEMTAFDAEGTSLGTYKPSEYWKDSPPRFGPHRWWWIRRRGRRGWFTYGARARLQED